MMSAEETESRKTSYLQELWDGQRFMGYSYGGREPDKDTLIIRDDIKTPFMYNGAPALGFLNDDINRVDKILNEEKEVVLELKGGNVLGISCYVINTKTSKHGDYQLWIAPERDYHIVKAVSIKGSGVAYKNGTLPPNVTIQESMEVIKFKLIDGTWIPMEVSVKHKQIDIVNGKKYFVTTHHVHKRTDILLNPDHETLGSFSTDHIPNGTTVGVPGSQIDYYWQDGKVTDSKGNVVLKISLNEFSPQ